MMLVVEELDELGIIRVSRWIFNCYLLLQPDGAIAVDAGLPSIADDVYPILQRRNVRLKSIIATHGHSDHLGGVSGLAAKFANCSIYIPAQTLQYIKGQQAPRTPSFRSTLTIWNTLRDQPFDWKALLGLVHGSFLAGFGPTSPMRWRGQAPKGVLLAGESVPGASEWSVVASAGHTDDSVSFYHRSLKILLSGDSIITANGVPHFTRELVEVKMAKKTQVALTKLPVQHLFPGHGRPVHAANVWSICDLYD